MLFVAPKGYASSRLRGNNIADVLGCRCLDRMDGTAEDVVVFVKSARAEDVRLAKSRGNAIVYDVIDFMCYPERSVPWASMVDILIVPNAACKPIYEAFFRNAKQVVIPHQWDPAIKGFAVHDKPRLGYIGTVFNFEYLNRPCEMVVEEKDMVASARLFNLHLAITKRDGLARVLKPATKASTAAAVGAVCVCYPDPSNIELLGDYPFYVKTTLEDAVDDAIGAFGSQKWETAREIMAEAKARTSIEAVCKLYHQLEAAHA